MYCIICIYIYIYIYISYIISFHSHVGPVTEPGFHRMSRFLFVFFVYHTSSARCVMGQLDPNKGLETCPLGFWG